MGITAITQAIAARAGALAGMRGAPSKPPDSIAAFPFAVTYLHHGDYGPNDATSKTGLLTWFCDIHLGRLPDVGRVLATYEHYVEDFSNALFKDLTLGSACDRINSVRVSLIPLAYNGIETFCYRFEIGLKYENAIT